jgi:hypothetical protein
VVANVCLAVIKMHRENTDVLLVSKADFLNRINSIAVMVELAGKLGEKPKRKRNKW